MQNRLIALRRSWPSAARTPAPPPASDTPRRRSPLPRSERARIATVAPPPSRRRTMPDRCSAQQIDRKEFVTGSSDQMDQHQPQADRDPACSCSRALSVRSLNDHEEHHERRDFARRPGRRTWRSCQGSVLRPFEAEAAAEASNPAWPLAMTKSTPAPAIPPSTCAAM